MYYSIKSGGWQRIAEPTGQEEGLLGIFPYEKMLACGKKWGISAEILEEARDLGIVVLTTEHTTYTACGLMYMAGIRGTNERTGAHA